MPPTTVLGMEFRRITGLPPYVFTIIDGLKVEARRAGQDVIDLGFGNPDLPSPDIAVDKLAEAVHNTRNHRYSASRGIPKLREAVSDLYLRRFGVELDPETEVINTIGAKEGFSHLMWVLLQPAMPRSCRARATRSTSGVRSSPAPTSARCRIGTDEDFFENVMEAWEYGWPKPRVIVLSFPHNPTTTCVDLSTCSASSTSPASTMSCSCTTSRTPRRLRRLRAAVDPAGRGAKECAVELYSMTKSFSMAGWRMAYLVGNSEVVQALAKLKSYLDYGTFQPIQIAATVTLNEAQDYPKQVQRDLPVATRRAVRRPRSHRLGVAAARGARCSRGRRSPSPTARWARSSSPSWS